MLRRSLFCVAVVVALPTAGDLVAQGLQVTVKDSVTSALLEGADVSLYCADALRASGATDATGVVTLVTSVDGEADGVRSSSGLLSAPYPNPSASRTNVRLSVEAPGTVRLAVYDLLGREILSRSQIVARGFHGIEVDLGSLPAGSYILKADLDGRRTASVRLVGAGSGSGTPALRLSAGSAPLSEGGLTSGASKSGALLETCEVRVERDGYRNARADVTLPETVEVTVLMSPGRETITNSIGMEFVRVKSGTFLMGSNNGTSPERPVHEVTISRDFYMGVYEVTQAQWVTVMGSNPSSYETCGDDCPVETVSWNDVQVFIEKLNEKEGTTAYRLPTEAEWEYAVRAGTTTEYFFGEEESLLDDYAWYASNSNGRTFQVGQKLPNPWGLYDVYGNVQEWVQDWYSNAYYSVSPSVDPQGPADGTSRVFRGNAFAGIPSRLRSAYRTYFAPIDKGNGGGFRLAKITE